MIFKKIIKFVISGLLPLMLVTSCGNDSTAPDDGLIFITPDKYELSTAIIAACPDTYPPATFIIESFHITVLDRNGYTVPGIDIDITASFTSSNSNFYRRLWLFDDEDGNNDGSVTDATGTLLDDTELVSGTGSPETYRTNTGPTGTKKIYFVVSADGGCAFTGNINVFSGKISNNFEIDYKGV